MDLNDVTLYELTSTIDQQGHHGGSRHVHLQFFDQTRLNHPPFSTLLCDNMRLRLPCDLEQWPPAVIFDFYYGCVAFHRWSREVSESWKSEWKEPYLQPPEYEKDGKDNFSHNRERTLQSNAQKNTTTHQGTRSSTSFAMDAVYALWHRHCQKTPDFTPVKQWLDDVASAQYEDDIDDSVL